MKINFRFTVGFFLFLSITGSKTILPSYAATLAGSEGSLEFNNFSHPSQDVSSSKSAFAYVLSEEGLAVAMTDPPFVIGFPFLVSPFASKFPVITEPIPGGEEVSAPLLFDSVTGGVKGSTSLTFSDSNAEKLLSANLSSESQLAGKDISHLVSIVGQSSFSSRFLIGTEETFSVSFQSSLDLETSWTYPQAEAVDVEESHVVYFFTRPADLELDNAFLAFSMYPHTRISASDPRINVGLLEVTGFKGNNSLKVTGNSSPLEFSNYFKTEGQQSTGNNLQGSLEYFADRPTILTLVAYTSSLAYSERSAAVAETVKVPERSNASVLIAIGISLFVLIGKKLPS